MSIACPAEITDYRKILKNDWIQVFDTRLGMHVYRPKNHANVSTDLACAKTKKEAIEKQVALNHPEQDAGTRSGSSSSAQVPVPVFPAGADFLEISPAEIFKQVQGKQNGVIQEGALL